MRDMFVGVLAACTVAVSVGAQAPDERISGSSQAPAVTPALATADRDDGGGQETPRPAAQAPDTGWKVDVVPIYLWAPVNLATVRLPSFPDLPPPPGGGDPSGDTDAGLTGAMMAAFRIEKGRWMVRGNFAWAGLSAERERPNAEVSGDIIYAEALTGVRIVNHLWLEGGVRRMAVDVKATVLDYPEVRRKPGYWDPVVGASYRLPMGDRWRLSLHGDGGGFGVGSELEANASIILSWRIVGRLGLDLGYQAQYIRFVDTTIDIGQIEKSLRLWATLHGPLAGIRLQF